MVESERDCPVCFVTREAMHKVPCCGHVFCERCLRKWTLNHRATCPMCRTAIEDVSCIPVRNGEVLILPGHLRRIRFTSYRTRAVVLEAPSRIGVRPGDVISTDLHRQEHPLRRHMQDCEQAPRICALRVERCYDTVVFRKHSVFVRYRGRTYVWRAGTLLVGARVTPSEGVRIQTKSFRRALCEDPWGGVRLIKFFLCLEKSHYMCDIREDTHYIFSAVR